MYVTSDKIMYALFIKTLRVININLISSFFFKKNVSTLTGL